MLGILLNLLVLVAVLNYRVTRRHVSSQSDAMPAQLLIVDLGIFVNFDRVFSSCFDFDESSNICLSSTIFVNL